MRRLGWFLDTGQTARLFLILIFVLPAQSIILSGAPNAYARYPKWAHSYENSLSLELKTKQSNGLLLYTDDGAANGNFYAITIADGRVQLDFRLGDNSHDLRSRPVTTIRIEEVRVDDNRWHTLKVHQSFENVKLELDYTLVFKILNQRSFGFGNLHRNSDLFVGGLPPDLHQLPQMSSPLRRHSKHLSANIRNLLYRVYPQGVTSPQLIDGHGVRQNEDDHCRPTGFSSREIFQCHHGGLCFSTNDGPKCDCSMSDHEGRNCEIEKSDAELSFSGQEWLGYDVSHNVSGPMRTRFENLTLTFKTVHGSALLFVSGDEKSYLHLMLEEGALIATSKFDGTDARLIRMFKSYPSERYDDDSWHTVVLERSLQLQSEKMSAVQMTLIVDGRKDEIRQYAPELDWINNAYAFLGGVPKDNPLLGVNRLSYRGCMKLVQYSADSLQIQFVNLADQGYGGSVIRTGGELSFSCASPHQPPDVLSFSDPTSPGLALPRWNADNKGGSLSFHFRSSEPDGLLFYHGALVDNSSEYIAFELIDGHLFMVVDLGAGPVRLQTTSKKISESEWHSVYMERMRRTGSVVVNSHKTDFHTPGTSANLDVVDPVFIGGPPPTTHSFPSTIWSKTLRKSFVGCIKNVRFNGISAKIASVFENSNTTGVSLGCPSPSSDVCLPNPCLNYGKCEVTPTSYRCDCAGTNMEGRTCERDPAIISIDGEQTILSVLPRTVYSEAENIDVRFKADLGRGYLLETKSNRRPRHRLSMSIQRGELVVQIETDIGNNSFSWGSDVADGKWHDARVKRRGQQLLLFLDGKWGKSYFLPSPLMVEMDEVAGGRSFHHDEFVDSASNDVIISKNDGGSFRGQLSRLSFNDIDLLEKLKKDGKSSKEVKGQRNVKSKLSSVSFTNTTGFVMFSAAKISSLSGTFRVSFKFQTLVRTAVLLADLPTNSANNMMLQLVNGRVRYSFRNGKVEGSITSPKLPNNQHLSDMRWHSLLVYQDSRTGEHTLLVDNTTAETEGTVGDTMNIHGPTLLGGIPSSVSSFRVPVKGFRGCISTLRINDRPIDILEESEANNSVSRGCAAAHHLRHSHRLGPIARCSPSACSNGGRCIQQWNSIRCDCSLTARAGERCNEDATTIVLSGEPAAVYYEYPQEEQPSSRQDYLVVAFKTEEHSGVVFSVECAADQDYLTVFLDKGFIQLRYNLGSRDHLIGYFSQTVNDGQLHTLRMFRQDANVTLQLDKKAALRYHPKSANELTTLNMHWRLVVGAGMNTKHLNNGGTNRKRRRRATKLFDPFQGELSGVNFNGIQILELYAQGSPRVSSIGPVKRSHTAATKEITGEDVMHDHIIENPGEALIESLGPGCLTQEEQDSCYIETEPQGFFTPVLPSAATVPRRATVSSARGESPIIVPTIAPSTRSPVVYLSAMDDLFEGSAEPPPLFTAATTPITTTTTTRSTTTHFTTTHATERPRILVTAARSTVLPRPYESVSQAAELNPEYLGESIWADVDILPEPMVTGPAWRTKPLNTTVTSTSTTTTTEEPTTTSTTTRRPKTTRTTPSTTTTTRRSTPLLTTERTTTSTLTFSTLISTTTKLTKPKTPAAFTVYPVRPTTPMGDLITTTMKYNTVETGEFPRTALVMIASLAVVLLIAIVVFCVFKCRQNPPPGDHYAMAVNGKSQSGYTPIAPELSPPLGMDPSTQPLLGRQQPQMNGNGYQPLKGSVIPNGNGNGAHMNGNGNGVRNGGGQKSNGAAAKKDFKEWYV